LLNRSAIQRPRPPQPMIPSFTLGPAMLARTASGLTAENATAADPAFARNRRRDTPAARDELDAKGRTAMRIAPVLAL
jgi:hypothetical protein